VFDTVNSNVTVLRAGVVIKLGSSFVWFFFKRVRSRNLPSRIHEIANTKRHRPGKIQRASSFEDKPKIGDDGENGIKHPKRGSTAISVSRVKLYPKNHLLSIGYI
jgi:hypothetical protein